MRKIELKKYEFIFEFNANMDQYGVLRNNSIKPAPAFLPKCMILDVLKAGHSSIYAGHPGMNKTKEKILSVYYWPGANTDIDQYIKSCEKCQLGKSTLPPKYPLQSLPFDLDSNLEMLMLGLFSPQKKSFLFSFIWLQVFGLKGDCHIKCIIFETIREFHM